MTGKKSNAVRALKATPRRKPPRPGLASADASKEEKRVWKKMSGAASPKKGTPEWEELRRRMQSMRRNAKRRRSTGKSQAREK